MKTLHAALLIGATAGYAHADELDLNLTHPGTAFLADTTAPPATSLAPTPTPQASQQKSIYILVLSGAEVAAPAAMEESARQEIEKHTALQIAPHDSFSDALRKEAISECA